MSQAVVPPRKIPALAQTEGAGAEVKRLFPSPHLRALDPFVLLDEFFVRPPAGFPAHPHRGFEVVTYMLEGAFEHRDDQGNAGTVTAGGLQRMTAGRGIVHSEQPGTPGLNRGLQLWINLPRALKQVEPEYQQVEADQLPETVEAGVTVRTVVGDGAPTRLRTPVLYLDLAWQADAGLGRAVPRGFAGLLYAAEGEATVDGVPVAAGEAALLAGGRTLRLEARAGARAFLIAGQPHGEPFGIRGSFVE